MDMPIKWRLVVLSAVGLLCILLLFHVFVYQLFQNMMIQTEQSMLENKLTTLSKVYETRRIDPAFLHGWLQLYVEEGQAIRIVENGKVEADVNKGISPALYLSHPLPHHKVREVRNWYGKQVSILAMPLDGPVEGRVELYTDFTSLRRYLDTMLTALFIGSSALLVLVIVGGYIMSTIALRPVSRITKTVRELDPSRMESRLQVPDTHDEIAELSRTFNELLDRIYQLIQKQKRFVADASHELRTPVSVIRGYTNMLKRWGKRNEEVTEEALTAIDQETARLEQMTDRLLRLARLEGDVAGAERELLDLTSLVAERVKRWRRSLRNHHIEWDETTPPVWVRVVRTEWEELIDILLDNAGKYSEPDDAITVRLESGEREVRLIVQDTGEGIPKEELPRVFERFYRAKRARTRHRTGSGLGLSIARQIVESYGGTIQIDSQEGEGTKVSVSIPVSQ
jgi:two-component system sensor histidine kinase ArlS